MSTFSIFTNIRTVVPYAVVSIENIIPIMQSEQLRLLTERVRTASTPEEKQERKGLLPYITVNGIFSQRNNASLVEYSGLTAVDFDHIPDEDMSNVKKVLGNDPHSLFGFVSPSGNGLKVIIRHDNTSPALHDLLYPQFIYYYRELLGIPYVDTSVKDACDVDGVPFARKLFNVYLPVITPYIFVGIVSSFSLSFKIEIMSEVISGTTSKGLGSIISACQKSDPTNMVPIFAYSLIAIIIVAIFSLLLFFIEKKIKKIQNM